MRLAPGRLAPALFLSMLAAASLAEDPPPPPKPRALTDIEKKVLDKVNSYRKAAGLKDVSMDVELSGACQKHADYLVTNYTRQKSEGKTGVDEIEGRAGFTKEGQKAGLSSAVHYVEPVLSVEELMGTFGNRVAFLQANLERIGLGVANGSNPAWYVVIDTRSGLTGAWADPFVLYPGDKQMNVPPLMKPGSQNPIPADKDGRAGFPITVCFKRSDTIANAKGTLKDAKGKEVAIWLVAPETSAEAKELRTIGIIAQDPLDRGVTYTAWFEADVNGAKLSKTWTFSTGKK
ncbi:MAG: hypothetical protein FD180_3003 [Planctomycetota bacterium]|nr:MAG: hypothetical protein FD180_3003 [Planctomycetota bacterium]